jgi:hypothetical protein
MTALLLAPLALQAAAMAIDEGVFHRRRGLPRWERIGHPLDTLTVLAPMVWALSRAPSRAAVVAFAVLGFISCLFVTKDEPVHARVCGVGERWLHAVLFVLHPIVFLCYALLWRAGETTLMAVFFGATLLFGVYQVLYWNVAWKRA